MTIVKATNSYTGGEVMEITSRTHRLLDARPDSQTWTIVIAAQIFADMGFECDTVEVIAI